MKHNNGFVSISRQSIAVITVVVLAQVGCNPTPQSSLPCSHWFDSALTSIPFDTLTQSNIRTWIEEHYPPHSIYKEADNLTWWRYEEREYIADLGTQPARTSLVVSFNPQPTIDTVVRCFGKPDKWATLNVPTADGPWLTQFTLWYFENGLMFRGYINSRDAKVSGNTLIDDLWVVKPRAATETVTFLSVPKVLESLKPWPIDQK